jgi:hypothetical protein
LPARKYFLYLSILFSLFFSSCQKEEITGTSDYKTLGTAAHDLLSASPYDQLQVEISYMPGLQPDAASINSLVDFLNAHLNKPAGIDVSLQQIPASGKSSLSLSEVVELEKKYRTIFTANRVAGVHLLITDGTYKANDVFATSYWNTSVCLFGKPIKENSDGPSQISRSRLFTTLFQHEFGHLLGLVNQGSPMQQDHKDADNGAHCRNVDCLMYFQVETDAASANTSIPILDNNCLADLKANGGK